MTQSAENDACIFHPPGDCMSPDGIGCPACTPEHHPECVCPPGSPLHFDRCPIPPEVTT